MSTHIIMQKKYIFLMLLLSVFFLFYLPSANVLGSDNEYSDIQDFLDSNNVSDFNFNEFVEDTKETETDFSFGNIAKYAGSILKNAIMDKVNNMRVMLSIIIVASIFKTFTSAFRNSQIADVGFYITYLFLFGVLGAAFGETARITKECLTLVLDFMKVLLPTYTAAVAFSTSTPASIILYEGMLMLITLCDNLIIKYILPLVRVFIIIMLIDCMKKENLLCRFGELVSTIIKWSLKSITGIVIGISSIQGITVPASSKLKHSLVYKTTSLLPVVGDAISSAAETVVSVGSVIKNAIGAAGIAALAALMAGPFIELVMYSFVYKTVAAIIQPISDERIINCINYSSEATLLLLRIMITCAVLFIIVIAVVALTF